MKESRIHAYTILGISLVLSLAVVAIVGCGGSNTTSSTSPTTGTVNTFLSDPPTCSAVFSHVYVTITEVQANVNASAGPNSSGWQTLVDLTSSPKQVDLLSLNPSATQGFCGTLYMLGTKALPPGKYQQIRLILLANNASGPSNNACSTGNNCVVPSGGSSSYELQLPSEAQTGIKIPSSQIANGGLTVSAGQSVDFNINFDTCASILQEGNGQYLLKPVLHSGEVTLNGTNTISGKVVEGTGSPNPGTGIGNAVVLLEQPNTSTTPPTDQVVWAGMTNSDGTFAFCPVESDGTNYDVVVAGTTTQTTAGVPTTTTYNPSVVFGVPVGGGTGSIPLFAETTTGSSTGLVSTGPASISGQITTSGSGSSPVAGNVQLSALQSVTNGSNTLNITVPVLQAGSTPSGNVTDSQPPVYTTVTTTSSSGGCATGSLDCVGYSVMVPASAAAVGTYDSTSGNNVAAPGSTDQAMYTINGLADGSDGLLTCSPTSVTSSSVTVAPGQSVDQGANSSLVLGFTGCTAPTP